MSKSSKSPTQNWPGDWRSCYESYIKMIHERSGSQDTYDHYVQYLTEFYASVPVDRLPDQVAREEIEAWLHSPGHQRGREGKPVTFGTQNVRLACLRSWFRYASEWPVLDEHGVPQPLLKRLAPTAGIRFLQREKPKYRSLTDADLQKFFGSIDKSTVIGARNHALFLALFWTARRKSEILALTWGAIQPAVVVDGGVRRQGYMYHFKGKGKSRTDDQAELPQCVYAAIVRYLEMSGKLPIMQPHWPVFTSVPGYAGCSAYDPERELVPHGVWALCKRIARAAGLENVCPHAFRHSAAAARYLAGQDVLSLQHLLRHSDLGMTQIYLSELTGSADSFQSQLSARYGTL
jgi:site-specific recombinase XerD